MSTVVPAHFHTALIVWTILAVITAAVLLRRTAPYGRHAEGGSSITLPHRIGWIVMEGMSPITLLGAFLLAGGTMAGPVLVFLGLWLLHYLYRAFIYPYRAGWAKRRMPVEIMGSAIFFNLINGSLNGLWFAWVGSSITTSWLTHPAFIAGTALWIIGLAINLHADDVLIRIRRQAGPGEYRIPTGGLYRLVSCPNYLGEIIEWSGFALLTWSPAAFTFAIWTAANLVPRAIAHHAWYKKRFPNYPEGRNAILPGVV